MSLRKFSTATLIVLASASLAVACSVPVFRYALEHWQPDKYTAYVFHTGPLTEAQQAVASSLQPKSKDGTAAANMVVKTIDLDGDVEPNIKAIRDAHPSDQTPWVVVQSPPKWGPPQTIWQGELNRDNVATVLNSPARSTVCQRLIDGQSVVWVFLDSGQTEEDDAAFTVLTDELKSLEDELKLPEIEEGDLKDLAVAADSLKIAFSAVRIDRDDKAEQAFIEMLLRIEPDLKDPDIINQPMAIPIFGRGRALYALIGKGIAPDVIKEASQFLTGACQCTVKAQNPGVDLVMNVNWDNVIVTTEPLDEGLPPLAGFSGFGVPEDSEVEAMDAAEEPEPVLTTVADAGAVSDTVEASGDSVASDVDSAASINAITSDATEENDAISSAFGPNVMMVILFLVVATVVATMVFRPKV
ncbi:hypothetical protein [Fuerstiella marisgermanici]|uniref:Uncharacterized protein n=1 Tax=Fuerstiella marisgermanici TaxID=1891926 RepID=A0A1P8WCZ8_9PLAN|nr:hypothetical protein [Fuerstiella marisgermanici]APZ91927.1 hypothetical protein Fuma_01525 [Fuerstiella marisgermanici]